jgi:N6-L-threonylcarbamoyladenine synthase
LKPVIFAIETSCDETAMAVFAGDKLLVNIVSSQVKIHSIYGGVIPELASREHIKNSYFVILKVIKELQNLKLSLTPDYIAYTSKPGLVGCLYVGKTIAETLALF